MIKNMFKMTKKRLVVDLVLLFCILGLIGLVVSVIRMPGKSYKGPFASINAQEKETEAHLRQYIQSLAGDIGQRNTERTLKESVDYIKSKMAESGYETKEQVFKVDNQECKNLECTLKGTDSSAGVILVGAHYDSVLGSPGANDNGSGVAATMEVARLLAKKSFPKTVRFVFFANEEPPYFSSEDMGSYFYAQKCINDHDKVIGLMVLETLGYYTDAPNSQTYPSNFVPGYPTTGNFIAFVGNEDSRTFTENCVGTFRKECNFPSEGVSAPKWVNGVDWSDQYWFWRYGMSAVMVTDTAPYRYPHYHALEDTPDKLSYPSYARVVVGISKVVETLASK